MLVKYFYILFFSLFLSSCSNKVVHDYPSSKDDSRFDSMRSVLGEDFVLHFMKVKNDSTKTVGSKVNEFLWKSSLEILKDFEIIELDKEKGIIITGWKKDENIKGLSQKIEVYIKDNVISPESIDIKIFRKKSSNNLPQNKSDEVKMEFEVIQRARELSQGYSLSR